MRAIIVVALALSLSLVITLRSPAAADHGEPWLATIPAPGQPLPTDAAIVLVSQNGPHPLVVEHSRHRFRVTLPGPRSIALRSTQLQRGIDWRGYGRSHVVLVTARPLPPNVEARLEVHAGAEGWIPMVAAVPLSGPNADYGGHSADATWPTASADPRPPVWRAAPVVDDSTLRVDADRAISFAIRAARPGARPVAERTMHAPVFGVSDEGCDWIALGEGPDRLELSIVPHDAARRAGELRRASITADSSGGITVCPTAR